MGSLDSTSKLSVRFAGLIDAPTAHKQTTECATCRAIGRVYAIDAMRL